MIWSMRDHIFVQPLVWIFGVVVEGQVIHVLEIETDRTFFSVNLNPFLF